MSNEIRMVQITHSAYVDRDSLVELWVWDSQILDNILNKSNGCIMCVCVLVVYIHTVIYILYIYIYICT